MVPRVRKKNPRYQKFPRLEKGSRWATSQLDNQAWDMETVISSIRVEIQSIAKEMGRSRK